MNRWIRFGLLIALLGIVALFFPARPALAGDCGTVASGTLTGAGSTNFGPFTADAGSTLFVVVTNTSTVTINYSIIATLNGFPAPLVNNGSVNAGETEAASAGLSAPVSGSGIVTIDGGSLNYSAVVVCPGQAAPSIPAITDGRLLTTITVGAVYADEDGVTVYAIDDKSVGKLALFVSAEELEALPENPDENLLVAQSEDGKFTLYKLTTGEYQVNMGPDAEGKTQVIIFDALPPKKVYGYQFKS